MSTAATGRKKQASSSVVSLTCARSWQELTARQLPRMLRLVHTCKTEERLRLRALCLLTGLVVVRKVPGGWLCALRKGLRSRFFFLRTWQFQSMAMQLSWTDTTEGIPVRMGCMGGRTCACDGMLHGLPFGQYLSAERQYQLFLLHREPRFLRRLFDVLYPKPRRSWPLRRVRPWHITAAFLWFMHCKQVLAKEFPWFFRPADEQADDSYDLIEQYNLQVRALTGGDITKERTILYMDTWRALTELNAKAREGAELKKKLETKQQS